MLHKEDKTNSPNDYYLVQAQVKDGIKELMNISVNEFSKSDEHEGFTGSCNAIHNIGDYFKFG